MELYLLRHGDALSHARDDASRPLSPLGEHQAAVAGRTMSRLGLRPQLVLSSPLARARQTASIVMEALGIDGLQVTEYLAPTTDPRQLLEELNGRARPSVLCVGHLPSLQIAASLIVSGTRDAALRVTTGTLMGLEAPPQIVYGSGMLKWLVSYEQMKAMLRDAPPEGERH
jgi:phosphohistidine phosphatase